MTPSLEGWPTKTKEAPFSCEVRLLPLDTNPVFQCLGDFNDYGDIIFDLAYDKYFHENLETLVKCFVSFTCCNKRYLKRKALSGTRF